MRSNLGSLFSRDVWNVRNARLEFAARAPNQLQVSLTNIVDEAAAEDGKPFTRSLGGKSYPLLDLSVSGEIIRNFYPRNRTFPLVFMPPLSGLTEGELRRANVTLSLKSGFRWAPTTGILETRTEALDENLVKISTTFELVSSPRAWFSGRKPTSIRGYSEYVFNCKAGRMLTGQASSELEQDLLLFHFRESWQMKLGMVEHEAEVSEDRHRYGLLD